MDAWNQTSAIFQFLDNPSSQNGLCAHDRGPNGGAVAETWIYPEQPNTALQEVQVEVNLYYRFDPSHSSHPGDASQGIWDLATVLTHELGHCLYLRHSSDPNAVMYGTLPANSVKVLNQDDINEITALYP